MEGVKVTKVKALYILMINWKTNLRHEISQIKCKFSVHYLVYNNYKLISGAAIGRGLENLESLNSQTVVGTYLKDRKIYILQAHLYNRNNTGIPAKGFSFYKVGGF